MKMLMFTLLIANIAHCASREDAVDLASIKSRLLNTELKIEQARELISIQAKMLGNNIPEIEGSVPITNSILEGNLPVKRDWYRLPGFDCGNGDVSDGGVTIYFPESLDSTYPIVSFLHGSGGGRFDGLCGDIAGLGMVVVAVDGGVCGDWSNQQVHAVLGSQQHKDLHPALSLVDFTSVGIIGHSEGGAYTQGTAAYHKEMPVKAAVMSHGGGANSAKDLPRDLPVYYATGSKDPRRHRLYPAFDIAPSRPSIFANVAGATHMAPARSGPQNAFMAHFLGCYLIPRAESCNMVFGEEDGTLCHGGANMASCIIRLPEEDDSNTIVEKHNKEHIRV